MKDIKFKVALAIIAVLAVILLYVAFIGPQIQGYITKNQLDAQLQGQQATVNAIMSIVNQQGYVVLSNEQNSIVLVRNPDLESKLADNLQEQQEQVSG